MSCALEESFKRVGIKPGISKPQADPLGHHCGPSLGWVFFGTSFHIRRIFASAIFQRAPKFKESDFVEKKGDQ